MVDRAGRGIGVMMSAAGPLFVRGSWYSNMMIILYVDLSISSGIVDSAQ